MRSNVVRLIKMKEFLDRSRFAEVLSCPIPEERAIKFLSYVEDQIRQDSWQDFHDDVFAIPACARWLYLPLCFDTGVRGDGMDDAFSFYGYSDDSLIHEIMEGFHFLGLAQVAQLISKALKYWRNPDSPMHTDSIPWVRMDQDLEDVHSQYFSQTDDLFSKVGAIIEKLGEGRILRSEG